MLLYFLWKCSIMLGKRQVLFGLQWGGSGPAPSEPHRCQCDSCHGRLCREDAQVCSVLEKVALAGTLYHVCSFRYYNNVRVYTLSLQLTIKLFFFFFFFILWTAFKYWQLCHVTCGALYDLHVCGFSFTRALQIKLIIISTQKKNYWWYYNYGSVVWCYFQGLYS